MSLSTNICFLLFFYAYSICLITLLSHLIYIHLKSKCVHWTGLAYYHYWPIREDSQMSLIKNNNIKKTVCGSFIIIYCYYIRCGACLRHDSHFISWVVWNLPVATAEATLVKLVLFQAPISRRNTVPICWHTSVTHWSTVYFQAVLGCLKVPQTPMFAHQKNRKGKCSIKM